MTSRDTLLPNGNYNRKTWEDEEIIYKEDLNTLEDIAYKNREMLLEQNKLIRQLPKWKMLCDITIEEEVNQVYFDRDIDNNEFEIDEFIAYIDIINTSNSSSSAWLTVHFNKETPEWSSNINYDGNMFMPEDGATRKMTIYYNRLNGAVRGTSAMTFHTQTSFNQRTQCFTFNDKIKSILLSPRYLDRFFGVNTTIKVFGR